MPAMPKEEPYIPPLVRRLMKDATEEELVQASENLRRYVRALYATFLRMEAEQDATVRRDSCDSDGHDRFQLGAPSPPLL